MKKVIGLFAIALSLISCTAQPLENDLKLNTDSNHYSFDWDSNQADSHATFIIYKQGVGINTDVTSKHFEIDIPNNTIFRFFIRDTTVRPLCSLKISKRKVMDLSSGVYKPNDFELIFSEQHNTNYFSFGATIQKDGTMRID